MTLWGFDVNDGKIGLDVAAAKRQGYDFMVAKVTEGQGYPVAGTPAAGAYQHFYQQAKAAGMLFAAYHFLRSDSTPAAQAANVARNLGDKTVPVWIDCEPELPSKPTLVMAENFRTECAKLGIKVAGIYYPHFWWSESGSLPLTGWKLWQALYGANQAGHGAAIYPGDASPSWAAQGGVVPSLLQFGSRGQIDGYTGNVDVNAFRGTRSQLAATGMFKDFAPKPMPAPDVHPVLRVLTANMRQGNPQIDAALKMLAAQDADVYFLNEIAGIHPKLRAALPKHDVIVCDTGTHGNREVGVAVRKTIPIVAHGEWQATASLGNPGGIAQDRHVQWARIKWAGRQFSVMSWHGNAAIQDATGKPMLRFPRVLEYIKEIRKLGAFIASEQEAGYGAIVGGDTNWVSRLFPWFWSPDAMFRRHNLKVESIRLDKIAYCTGFTVADRKVVQAPGCDHHWLIVDLEKS